MTVRWVKMWGPRLGLAALALGGFSSCASFYRLPTGYNGPTAVIRNSSRQANLLVGEEYKVVRINGSQVETSRAAVTVKAEPLTLKLSGTAGSDLDSTGNVASRQRFETIAFTPKPGGEYRVTGALQRSSTTVWLTDEKTGAVVGRTAGGQ